MAMQYSVRYASLQHRWLIIHRFFVTSVACLVAALIASSGELVQADSRGEALAEWLNHRGEQVWGVPPEKCDDLTFARRIYLDLLGRVPSVAELRDFESLPEMHRRRVLIDAIIFGEGERGKAYSRLAAQQLARQWRRILLPSSTTVRGNTTSIESWLASEFESRVAYDQLMKKLVRFDGVSVTQQYFQATGGLPENYAGNISRALLGVRIECAQCHDHPFSDWKQKDFWGLAAFYGDIVPLTENPIAPVALRPVGKIQFEGQEYRAKFLWSNEPDDFRPQSRTQLGDWLTSSDNPQFAATAVNRFWQNLIGRGLYWDVENLDQATQAERLFVDEFGHRFSATGFQIDQLMAAICKSNWYQAVSYAAPSGNGFYRPLKSVSPEQIFDSLEQALQLPISRIDPSSPRYSGDGAQLKSRLSESIGSSPEEYASGIPQALLLMNGKLTSEAIDLETSRLLRAVVDSPFFSDVDQIEVLYMAVLTRRPSPAELSALSVYCDSQPADKRKDAMGEILWALLNSPEFVLCR